MSPSQPRSPVGASLVAYLVLVAVFLDLMYAHAFFAAGWIAGAVQVLAAALMLWARLTFGLRSFHATANPTEGGLVTRGPYRFLRHPIYASILWFLWAAVLSHPSMLNGLLGALATGAVAIRIRAEETLLRRQYPGYVAYAARTRRVIPFVF